MVYALVGLLGMLYGATGVLLLLGYSDLSRAGRLLFFLLAPISLTAVIAGILVLVGTGAKLRLNRPAEPHLFEGT